MRHDLQLTNITIAWSKHSLEWPRGAMHYGLTWTVGISTVFKQSLTVPLLNPNTCGQWCARRLKWSTGTWSQEVCQEGARNSSGARGLWTHWSGCHSMWVNKLRWLPGGIAFWVICNISREQDWGCPAAVYVNEDTKVQMNCCWILGLRFDHLNLYPRAGMIMRLLRCQWSNPYGYG